jgi:hypothetical protein
VGGLAAPWPVSSASDGGSEWHRGVQRLRLLGKEPSQGVGGRFVAGEAARDCWQGAQLRCSADR